MSYTISMLRQFQSADAYACCDLVHACLEADISISPALGKMMRAQETPQSMEERARLFYVAVYELEKRIVGIAGLDMNEIRLLCVSPQHQRRGIGRSLLAHIKARIPEALFSDIFVYSSLQAIGFYESCGFLEKSPYSFSLYGEMLHTVFLTFPIKR
jgi:N-acetylglutamate synthase-like GNAT family acetyltransferase